MLIWTRLPSSVGIGDESEFDRRSKACLIRSSLPSSVGIAPVSVFSNKDSQVSSVSSPNSVGIVPS